MNVLCPYVDRQQFIASIVTHFTNSPFDYRSLICVERHWWVLQQLSFRTLQTRVRHDTWSTILVLFAIDGPTFVAMKPGSVCAKGDEVRERKFVIVKISNHGREVSFLC